MAVKAGEDLTMIPRIKKRESDKSDSLGCSKFLWKQRSEYDIIDQPSILRVGKNYRSFDRIRSFIGGGTCLRYLPYLIIGVTIGDLVKWSFDF